MKESNKKASNQTKMVIAGGLILGGSFIGYKLGCRNTTKQYRKMFGNVIESAVRNGEHILEVNQSHWDEPVVLMIKHIGTIPENFYLAGTVRI